MKHPSYIPYIDPASLLHEIAQSTGDLVVITDRKRTILYANPAAVSKTGYNRRQLVGIKMHHLFREDHRARYTSKITQGLQKRGRWSGEIEVQRKEGTTFWIEAEVVGLSDGHGRATGIVGVGRDLTDSRLLDRHAWESEGPLSAIVESMEDALYVCDPAGKILMCNRAHGAALGYRREEIIGLRPPYPWIDRNDARKLRDGYKLLLKHGTLKNYAIRWRRRDGSSLAVSLAISVMRDRNGEVSGFVHTVRDVTEVHYVEELGRSNERIQRLVADVRRKAERLQTLEAVNRLVLGNTGVSRIFRAVTSGIRRLVGHDLAGIYAYDAEHACLQPHTLSKQTRFSRKLAQFPLSLGEGIIGAAAVTGKMVWVNNAQLDPRSKYPPGMKPEKEHFIAVPLMGGGPIFGVLVVSRNRDPEFIEEETQIVRSFAEAATVALENARLSGDLKSRRHAIRAPADPAESGAALDGPAKLLRGQKNIREPLRPLQ